MTISNATPDSGTTRRRWLDRWLEPRWRGLLTWLVLATLTAATFPRLVPTRIPYRTAGWVSDILYKFFADPIADFAVAAAFSLSVSVLVYWFQPIILRISIVRTLIWLALAGVILVLVEIIHPQSGWTLLSGQVFGIAGLAVSGARTRPWLSLVGGLFAFAIVCLLEGNSRSGQMIVGNLIYGAVMLYGTDPLPRSTSTNVLSPLPKPQ